MMKTQENVTVEMERDDTKIVKIEFPAEDAFYIYWEDGSVTKYRYNYVKHVIKKEDKL